jgi:16S rRNA (cytosine967-C5)-methyltransferase
MNEVSASERLDEPEAGGDAAAADAGTSVMPRWSPPLFCAAEQAVAVVLRLDGPSDAVLRAFFKSQPRWGRRDRSVISELVFDVLRHRRRYAHLMQSLRGDVARRMVWMSLARRFGAPGVAALKLPEELAQRVTHLGQTDPGSLPQAIRLSLPEWLYEALLADLGEGHASPHAALESLGQALLQPAPLDVRVNLLKSDRAAVRQALVAAGIAAEVVPHSETGLRVAGRPALECLPAFQQGWFEVQDAGSQRLADFAAPRRGQTVIDFCAGAGGKTLALAAAMRSTGQIYACDVSKVRLQRLKPRLARSGATNVQPFGIDSEQDPKLRRLAGRGDLVLVDAPCSGTGTLRRNPELKWRMSVAAVEELHVRQSAILDAAAKLVKRGGALVYATCSLLTRENEAVVAAFGERHSEFGVPEFLRLRPDVDGCDGFFSARWVRSKSA